MSTKFLSPGWRMPRNANQSKQSNYSMDFDGGSRIDCGNDIQIFTDSHSYSFWVKKPTISEGYIFGYGIDSVVIFFGDGRIRFYTGGLTSGTDFYSSTSLSTNTWYHICCTYEKNGDKKIYIDGSLDNTISTSGTIQTGGVGLTIAARNLGGSISHYFTGQLDGMCLFNYALLSSQVTTLWGGGTSVSNPMALPSPPIAYYPLGTSAWNGNFLAENNAIGDYVFDFSGNDDCVDVASSNDFAFGTNGYSLSLWFKPDGNNSGLSNAGVNILDMRSTSVNEPVPSLWLRTDGASGFIKLLVQLNAKAQATVTLNSGNWYHVIVTNDGYTSKIYLNGNTTPIASGTDTTNYLAAPLKIGKFYANTQYSFNGKISNVQIFNTALPDTEVETLYNNGSPIKTLANIPQSSNLKAWYKLDASEIYNSLSTEWSVDNNQNPSNYDGSVYFNGTFTGGWTSQVLLPSNFTFSFWIKTTYTGSTYTSFLESASSIPANEGYDVFRYNNMASGRWRLNTNIGGLSNVPVTPVINDGKWHNIIVNYNPTTTTMTVYTDNQQSYSSSSWDIGTNQQNITRLGKAFDGSGAAFTDTNLSNLAVWTGDLTTSQRAELFNNGTPSILTTHSNYSNLNHWWTMQDKTGGFQDVVGSSTNVSLPTAVIETGFVNALAGNSSGMSQTNLVQSDLQTVAPFSKYALNFDAIDLDRIDTGVKLFNDMTSFTASIWAKGWSTSTLSVLMSQYDGGNNPGPFILTARHSTNTDGFTAWIDIGGTFYTSHNDIGFSDNTKWINLVATWDGSNIILYINGIAGQTTSASGTIRNTTLYNFFIGGYPVGINSNSYDGELSNCAVWNTALSATQVREIYNEGLPSDLNSHSAVSSLASWWQLGENSSFASNWICADEKGTNNGESVNMGVDALTNGVGTTANGTSSGMAVGALVGNAPYSTANAISSGMAVTAKGTDVPS